MSAHLRKHVKGNVFQNIRNFRCKQYFSTREIDSDSNTKLKITEESDKIKKETNTLMNWNDVSIVNRKGRCYDPSKSLIQKDQAKQFPSIQSFTLNGKSVTLPQDSNVDIKLVAFSFKHYGFTLLRSWIDPFTEIFPGDSDSKPSVKAIEICFVEYSFLSIAKSVFASNIKTLIQPTQMDYTALSFGGVADLAEKLKLPNAFTGYVFLLDKNNKIRWKASGQAEENEIKDLIEFAKQLQLEK